ncbi:zinc ribbon domain-containing protein [Actinokineospora inagensis]|uniref:zinc ribbon domain-containing protein n=1 Tax=Actinokineospora inagensis TaxID=103730 RepID=UPI00041548E5|nr:zinc ribbon domain-containing protein [Actinokineospora inagensis]
MAEGNSPAPHDFPPTASAFGPVSPGQPKEPDEETAAVLPGRPVARRPVASTTVAADPTVGPPCPNCGTPNPPDRNFCRRCATPLTDAAAAAVARQRRRRWSWHGDRSRWLRRLAALLVVIALVLLGVLLYPQINGVYQDIRDKLATPVAIGPHTITATAEVPGHPAKAAADGLSNRYWGSPAPGADVTFTFSQPFRFLAIVIHAGPTAEQDHFTDEARPSAIDLTATASDGTTTAVPISLADQPGPQRTDLGISDVTKVTLHIRSATGLTPTTHIALGEVEFFRR